MHRQTAIRQFFVIAAIIFIAKPFLGFSSYDLLRTEHETIILVKAFTKRMPEYFAEAEAKKAAIHQSLTNPPVPSQLTLTLFLALLLPSLLILKNSFQNAWRLNACLSAGNKTYLLTGKLTI